MSGAVGSRPSLMRSGTPVASDFASLRSQSSCGVASVDPSPDRIIQRELVEDVAPLPVDNQLRQLEDHSFSLYRTDTTRASDTADALLARLGIADAAAANFLRHEPTFRAQVLGRWGRAVSVETNDRNELLKLTFRCAPDAS